MGSCWQISQILELRRKSGLTMGSSAGTHTWESSTFTSTASASSTCSKTPHARTCYTYTWRVGENAHTTQSVLLHLHSPPLSHAAAPALSFYLSPLCLPRGQQLPDSPCPDSLLFLSPSLPLPLALFSSLRHALSIIHHWNSQTVMI